MFGGNEIILSGRYKDFDVGFRLELGEAEEKEVAGFLSYISNEIEPYAFKFSGMNIEKIDGFVKVNKRGISAVIDFIKDNSSEWNRMIKKELKENSNPKLISVAESYFFNRLLSEADVDFKIDSKTPSDMEKEEIEDQIAFIGRYGKWMAIKKLTVDNVQDYEVSGILSGINYTAINKSFDFAGVEKNDNIINDIKRGKRKSYRNVAECLEKLEEKLDGTISDRYMICKLLEEMKYAPYASPGMLTDAYPDIKPPKSKGRKPKG